MDEGDELMPSSRGGFQPPTRAFNTTSMNTRAPRRMQSSNSHINDDSDAPDDEMESNHSGSNSGQMQDEFTNQTQSSKKKTKDRPWKKSKEYDAIQTDDVDICGVHPDDADASTGISVENDHDDDDDDDISYDESTAPAEKTSAPVNVNTADILGTEDVSSRWSKEQTPSTQEVKDAHVRAVSLATERARRKEENDDMDDLSLASRKSDSSRRSNHQQVRMEALKLLEIANSSGSVRNNNREEDSLNSGTGTGIRGGGRFKAVREKSSALRGIGLNNARQRRNYERVPVSTNTDTNTDLHSNSNANLEHPVDDNDVFTTNPSSTPIKGQLADIEIQEDIHTEMDRNMNMNTVDGDVDVDGQGKKTWGSRYSIDRHLRALHGGLTSQQVLNKMDRDHYNKLNQNTSATNMCKTSPHEDDDRWGVESGRKGDKYKNRMWYTWIEAVKEKFAAISADKSGSHTFGSHRYADHSHSSPSKGIFTGVAITKFLDRLSPMSRARHENGEEGQAFSWRNANGSSEELPSINFSADGDVAQERKKRRMKMFWCAVFVLSCVTIFSIIGVTVHKAGNRRRGGGYIDIGEEVNFFVTSDVPFNKADETKLSRELDDLKLKDGDFLIHLGDINKASSTLCTFSVYDDAASLLKQSPVPVIVLPGNNDWNECPMPEAAFENWMDKLNRFEDNFDPDEFPNFPIVNRQSGRDENFAFLHKGVLFIAVHLVDGRVQDEREWSIRDQENLQWVEKQLSLYDIDEYRAVVLLGHAGYSSKIGDFFWPVMDDFRKKNKPVLYLHANDGEGMIEYHPVDDFQKFTAVRLEKGSKIAPTQITVGGGSKPFSYFVTEED